MEKEEDYKYEVPDSSKINTQTTPKLGDGRQNALVKTSRNPFNIQNLNRFREAFMNNVQKVFDAISKPFHKNNENQNTISPTIIKSKSGEEMLKDNGQKEETVVKNPNVIVHDAFLKGKSSGPKVVPQTIVGNTHSKESIEEEHIGTEVDVDTESAGETDSDGSPVDEIVEEPQEVENTQTQIYDPFVISNIDETGIIEEEKKKDDQEQDRN